MGEEMLPTGTWGLATAEDAPAAASRSSPGFGPRSFSFWGREKGSRLWRDRRPTLTGHPVGSWCLCVFINYFLFVCLFVF